MPEQNDKRISRHFTPGFPYLGITALFDHLSGGELCTEEGAFQVNVEYLFVLLFGGVQHRGAALDSGIVHHDVNTPKPDNCGINQQLPFGELADVSLDADCLVSQRNNLLFELLRSLRMRDVVDNNICASASAMALPMPLFPPVTMQLCPSMTCKLL